MTLILNDEKVAELQGRLDAIGRALTHCNSEVSTLREWLAEQNQPMGVDLERALPKPAKVEGGEVPPQTGSRVVKPNRASRRRAAKAKA